MVQNGEYEITSGGEAQSCERIVHPLGYKRMVPSNLMHMRYLDKTKYAISRPLNDSLKIVTI